MSLQNAALQRPVPPLHVADRVRPFSRFIGKQYDFTMTIAIDHVFAELTFREHHEGPPGHAHGGSIAAVMDEIMGTAPWAAGFIALAAHLDFDYRKSVPLNTPVHAKSWIERVGNRSIHTLGELRLEDGTLLLNSRGVFVHVGDAFPTGGGGGSNPRESIEILMNSRPLYSDVKS